MKYVKLNITSKYFLKNILIFPLIPYLYFLIYIVWISANNFENMRRGSYHQPI